MYQISFVILGGLFGASQSTGSNAFGGFGTPQTSTVGFGAAPTATAAAPAPFSFGGTQVSAAPSFGFGTTSTAPSSLGFGTQTSTAAPSFSFGSQPQTSFGAAAPSSSGGFFNSGIDHFHFLKINKKHFSFVFIKIVGLGTTGTSTFGLGSFGNTGQSAFGGQQQQQQVPATTQQASTPVESVLSSVLYCNVYGDERDAILARWNLLQAAWGTGKGNNILYCMLYNVISNIFSIIVLICLQDFTQGQLMQYSTQLKIRSVVLKQLDTANFFKARMKTELLFFYLINPKRMCGNFRNKKLN